MNSTCWIQTFSALVICYGVGSASPSMALSAGDMHTEPSAIAEARRDLQVATLERRLYNRVEYPLQRRQLESKIRLAEAERDSLKRRLVEWESFNRFKRSSPIFATLETTKLELLEVELHLSDLKEEKLLIERYHADRRQLFELRVDAAEARVEGLEKAASGKRARRPR